MTTELVLLSSYLVCNFQAPWPYKLQPKNPSTAKTHQIHTSCVFQRARSGLQVEADRKSKVRCEAGAEAASPLVPSTPRLPISQVPQPWDTVQAQQPHQAPATQSHLRHNISSSRKRRAQLQEKWTWIYFFKLILILHQIRQGAKIQNTSFSILCYERQFRPCICIL